MDTQAQMVADLLKIISNKYRLMILCILEEGKHSVSELSTKIDHISMPAMSQHLSSLKLAGFIKSEKNGLHVYYEIQDYKILEVIKVLKEIYCKD